VIEIAIKNQSVGDTDISGTLTKTKDESFSYENEKDMDAFYLSKIGRLIEDQENLIVRQLDEVYVGKTKQIIFDARYLAGEQSESYKRRLAQAAKEKNM